MAGAGAFVVRLFRHYRYKLALNAFRVRQPIGNFKFTERKASVCAIDRVHNPTSNLRTLEIRNRYGRREKFGSINNLHDAIATRAVRKIDAVTCGASGYGTMDRRYRIKSVWKGDVNVLLPIKRPIPDEHRICRILQVEYHDVVPRP